MLWKAKGVITSSDPMVLEDGALLVEGERLKAVGPAEELERDHRGQVREFPDGIIMPGLINAHCHAAMVAFRGLADDLPLSEWLGNYIWPAEQRVISEDFIRDAAKIALHEMLRGGTTLFADMYFFQDVLAEEVQRAGMRAVLTEGVIDYPTPSAKTPEEGLERTRAFIQRWKGNPQVFPGVGLHAPYSCSQKLLEQGAALARDMGVSLHMHLAETRSECDEIRQAHSTTPVRYLEKIGVLGEGFVGAHGVWVDRMERDILAKTGAGVAHCPQSNAKLGSGVAPLPEYLEQGVKIGLGTDGAASNNNLDMFDEMRFCALVHKAVSQNPTVASAEEVLKAATVGGAKLLGLADRLGSLEKDKLADFIVVDASGSHMRPLFSPVSQIVYAARASDVRWVVIGGRTVVEDGKVLTVAGEALRDAEERIKREIKEVF